MVFGLGLKLFGCGLVFGVERFWIGWKSLGFGGGFLVWGFEIWVRVWGLGCWDFGEGLGLRVCGFDSEFLVWGFLIWCRIWHLGYWYLT